MTTGSVIQVLRNRQNKTPPWTDGAKLGLVIEGGGMRGTYSMAALDEMRKLGCADSFDYVAASSSGAINGSYFLSGQTEAAVEGYCHDLSTSRFINLLRWQRKIDIDYMIDHVVKGSRRLDLEAMVAARSEFEVYLADSTTAQPLIVDAKTTELDWYEVLRGTAALPVVYGRDVPIGKSAYIDGGVADPIPVRRAAEVNCTHVLVMLTETTDRRRERSYGFLRLLKFLIFSGHSDAVRRKFLDGDPPYNEMMQALGEGQGEFCGAEFYVHLPSDWEKMVDRLTKDEAKLRLSTELARRDIQSLLQG